MAYVKLEERETIRFVGHSSSCMVKMCECLPHTMSKSYETIGLSSIFNCKFMGSSCEVNLTSSTECHSQAEKLAKVITVAAGRTDEKINVWSIFFIVSPIVHTEHSAVWGHSHCWEHTWQHRRTHFSRVECCECVCVCALKAKIVRKLCRHRMKVR